MEVTKTPDRAANADTKQAATVPVQITLEMIFGEIHALREEIKTIGAGGAGRGNRQSQREMTDDDARQVLTDIADLKHNEAADKLGLSYGQVYSCRLGYTFKNVRADLVKNGVKSKWLETDHNDTKK